MLVSRRSLYAPGVRQADTGRVVLAPMLVARVVVSLHPSLQGWESFLLAPKPGTTLEDAQQYLVGEEPTLILNIGGDDLSAYVVHYRYDEAARKAGGLALWLDNRANFFGDLATNAPNFALGQSVSLKRGITVLGIVTYEELPTTWVESYQYSFHDNAPYFLIYCIDAWGKLARHRYDTETTWASKDVGEIVGDILSAAGLTLDAGNLGLDLTYTIGQFVAADTVIRWLMNRVDDFLFAKLGGAMGAKPIPDAESGAYAYTFTGSGHPLMENTELSSGAARYNSIRVEGAGVSGTATDSGEASASGSRWLVVSDSNLTTSAQCSARAQAELDHWIARRTSGRLVARPHYSLRVYDVVSVAAPPWGGSALSSARVIAYTELYGWEIWEQQIQIGELEFAGQTAIVVSPPLPDPLTRKQKKNIRRKISNLRRRARRLRRMNQRRRVSSQALLEKISMLNEEAERLAGVINTVAPGSVDASAIQDGAVTNSSLDESTGGAAQPYKPLGLPKVLDLGAINSAYKGFWGGCSDGQYGYVAGFDIASTRHGWVVRFGLVDFDAASVSALDLTVTDSDLKGLGGIVSDGRNLYTVPYQNSLGVDYGKVARIGPDFSTVTVLDLTSVDSDLKGFIEGVIYSGFLYLCPFNASELVKVDLSDFTTSGVSTLDLTATDSGLTGMMGAFVAGGFLYVCSYSNSKIAKVDLSDFSTVTVLDLSAVGVGGDAFSYPWSDGRYGYTAASASSYVVRFDLANFGLDGVTTLQLSTLSANYDGFRGVGTVGGRYAILVPYGSPNEGPGDLGGVARIDMTDFTLTAVEGLTLTDIDSDLADFQGGFGGLGFGFFVPESAGGIDPEHGKVVRFVL